MSTVVQDIFDLKHAEHRLRESETCLIPKRRVEALGEAEIHLPVGAARTDDPADSWSFDCSADDVDDSSRAVRQLTHDQRVDVDRLYVKEIFVDGGPVLKRIRPQPMGRAFRILKRQSHVTIRLDTRKGEA